MLELCICALLFLLSGHLSQPLPRSSVSLLRFLCLANWPQVWFSFQGFLLCFGKPVIGIFYYRYYSSFSWSRLSRVSQWVLGLFYIPIVAVFFCPDSVLATNQTSPTLSSRQLQHTDVTLSMYFFIYLFCIFAILSPYKSDVIELLITTWCLFHAVRSEININLNI